MKKLEQQTMKMEQQPAEMTGQNRSIDDSSMLTIRQDLQNAAAFFEPYHHNYAPTDRRKLIGAGVHNSGFIELALQSATANPTLVPTALDMAAFTDVMKDVVRKRELLGMVRQLEQDISESLLEAGDVAFHKALWYYNALKEAAKQKMGSAELLFKTLEPYFKKKKTEMDEPTRKQLERDLHALLNGTKDGEVVVKNVRPKTIPGERKVVDSIVAGKAEEEVKIRN